MKAKLKKQLQAIANISQDRVYFDVPDDLADEMFDLYDPSDLYSYLTQKERNQAYRAMQGIGANSRQVQMEWKKKALWRIAKAKAWDDLYELDESITSQILAGKSVRAVLMESLEKNNLFVININEAVPLTKSRKILAVRDELQKNGSVEIDDKEIAMMYKVNKNPYMHFEVEELPGGKYRISVVKGNRK